MSNYIPNKIKVFDDQKQHWMNVESENLITTKNDVFKRVFITKPCNHLHPAPSTSTQLHPSPSTSTQLISASNQLFATPSTLLEPKYRTQSGNYPKFGQKNSKLSILTEYQHTWNLGGTDSESGLRFLKFRPQNSFLGKFGLKKSKLSVLSEN